jgi:hypothetical protein
MIGLLLPLWLNLDGDGGEVDPRAFAGCAHITTTGARAQQEISAAECEQTNVMNGRARTKTEEC